MIRTYFDWNVISCLKKPEYSELSQFITKHKDCLQFPYSPAHFNDLMKSYSQENAFFDTDLERLEYLSGKHLLQWENNRTAALFCTPKEYFNGIKNQEDTFSLMDFEKLLADMNEISDEFGVTKIGDNIKNNFMSLPSGIEINANNNLLAQKIFPNINSNSSMWDFFKDFSQFSKTLLHSKESYKDLRRIIGSEGVKLDENAGNWSEDIVIERINYFLNKVKIGMTFFEFIDFISKRQNKPFNRFQFFTTAYLLLDMIGYKPDKLRKPTDSIQNIINDAQHSFYAAHCDYFVALDKKLLSKTKVLYKELNISTMILSPEDYIQTLSIVIHKTTLRPHDLVNDAVSYIKKENITESYPIDSENKTETYLVKLPIFYLNFFNFVTCQFCQEKNVIHLVYNRIYTNYSTFVYFTEIESLLDLLTGHLGYNNLDEYSKFKAEFIYQETDIKFVWHFDGGKITLLKDTETHYPVMIYTLGG